MIFYINKLKKIVVGRNNQTATQIINIDFQTIGEISFSFIDDRNKILPIEDGQYYFAGKKDTLLFFTEDFKIENNVLTFKVDTYTEPFLNAITKRNTEIEVEIGFKNETAKNVCLRDYAFAQPRVYIDGLPPGNIALSEYYTKTEIDALFSEVKNLIPEIPEIPDVPTKVSELENDSGFISGYTETDPIFTAVSGDLATKAYVDEVLGNNEAGGNNAGRIFSDPKFLYLNSRQEVSVTTTSAYYTGVLGDNPPKTASVIIDRGFNPVPPKECFCNIILTYNAGDDFELTPNDKLDMVIGAGDYTTPEQIITCELYADSILIRRGQIGYLEGLTIYNNLINSFNLIKLNEIVDDKTISGSCLLEIKIRYYNGKAQNAYDKVLIQQNTNKIFQEAYRTKPNYCGLAKNLSFEDYYCYGKNLDYILKKIQNNIQDNMFTIYRNEFQGSFDGSLSENWVYYMSPAYCTNYLNIYGFSNNSMIVFNTDPDNDFVYSFIVDSVWRINKPFNFQKGKSYAIACEANCIFWCEVQNYE